MMKEMMELKIGSEKIINEKFTNEKNNEKEENNIDFKANLRKISKPEQNKVVDDIVDMKSKLRKVEVKQVDEEDDEDKRRSTGSISSLKKLWEGESPPEVVKERKWPPEEKPAVPTKPNVRPVVQKAPAIYATPGGLANVIEISQALETSINNLKTASTVTSANWLQLSDKVGLFHGSCLSYVNTVAPPQTRFHLMELLNRLESQGRQLRSAGTKNQADNTKLLDDLHNTLKDVVNAVQR